MLVIAQIQDIRNNLGRLLGKVKVTDGSNDMPAMDAHERAGYQNVAGMPLAMRTEWAELATCYVGWAAAGTATSCALWRIKKIVISGEDITVTWADGDADFDNVWDDRASLSYS